MTLAKRSIVIPDIHGCAQTFQALLERLSLKRTDTLFLLGDYIDRGPDSKGVITTILALCADGFDVRPILGNHEDLLQNCIDRDTAEDHLVWHENGGDATLISYKAWGPKAIDPEHLAFIRQLPLYCQTDSHVFVHAGLDPFMEDPFLAAGREAMLWRRGELPEPARIRGRTVVCGHTIASLGQIRDGLTSRHVYLDNGCFTAGEFEGLGNLVALEIETGYLHVQGYIG